MFSPLYRCPDAFQTRTIFDVNNHHSHLVRASVCIPLSLLRSREQNKSLWSKCLVIVIFHNRLLQMLCRAKCTGHPFPPSQEALRYLPVKLKYKLIKNRPSIVINLPTQSLTCKGNLKMQHLTEVF